MSEESSSFDFECRELINSRRSNLNQKWKKCKKCGMRVYAHRQKSHICQENLK
jgi:hypothetical protein